MTPDDVHPELGPLIADHPPNYAVGARRMLGGLASLTAAVVALVGTRIIPLPIREEFWETVSIFVLAGILLAIGVFYAYLAVSENGPRIRVYEQGLVAGREVFPWNRVSTCHQLAAALDVYVVPVSLSEYILRRDDGRQLGFTDGVCQAGRLAARIQERINPRLLAEARAALAAGREVDFGHAVIEADGLRFTDLTDGRVKKAAWSDIRTVEADGMQISVRTGDESLMARLTGVNRIATRQVANVGVMLALVGEILKERRSG